MDEVLTQTKFDILRTRLSPTALPISKVTTAKAAALHATSEYHTIKKEARKNFN